MASDRDIYLIPQASVNERWEKDTFKKNFLKGIRSIDYHILQQAEKKSSRNAETLYGWYVSPTFNGILTDDYIYTTTCIRGELIMLCMAHASIESWNIHHALKENGKTMTAKTIRTYFSRLRRVYFILRDVAKVELIRWTCRPLIPPVAELSEDTINFMLAYVCGLFGLCACMYWTRKETKVDKDIWARATLFVAERFATAYTILYEKVWPNYGCQHVSAAEVSKTLAGYSMYYYCKSYATLLHTDEFCIQTTARQKIALARCVEYLATALKEPTFGFSGNRIDNFLTDMRSVISKELPLCEEPIIGRESIVTGSEYNRLFSIVSSRIPTSENIMKTTHKSSDGKKPYFHDDPNTAKYNIAHHGINFESRKKSKSKQTQTTKRASVPTDDRKRKPKFELNDE